MGIDRSDYLMFGTKIDPDSVDYDEHIDLIEGHEGAPFTIISDFMCGDYAVAGRVIADADDPDGFDFTELDISNLQSIVGDRDALTKAISERLKIEPEAVDLKLYLFSNFS